MNSYNAADMYRFPILASVVAITSCAQSNGPAVTPSSAMVPVSSCYIVKQQPTSVRATITFYGWPDNSPPGNKISHPVLHQHAGGDGTYCNPTTFATERSNNARIPYGDQDIRTVSQAVFHSRGSVRRVGAADRQRQQRVLQAVVRPLDRRHREIESARSRSLRVEADAE